MRRKAVDSGVELINDIKLAEALVEALVALHEHGGMSKVEVHDHKYFLGLQ